MHHIIQVNYNYRINTQNLKSVGVRCYYYYFIITYKPPLIITPCINAVAQCDVATERIGMLCAHPAAKIVPHYAILYTYIRVWYILWCRRKSRPWKQLRDVLDAVFYSINVPIDVYVFICSPLSHVKFFGYCFLSYTSTYFHLNKSWTSFYYI